MPRRALIPPAFCLLLSPVIAAEPSPLDRLVRKLQTRHEGILVVIEGEAPGPLTRAMEHAARQEALLPFLVETQHLPWEKAGEALSRREGWGPEPRWAILNAEGKVLATDPAALPAETLAERFESAGWLPPARRLEALLARSQDHTGVREALLAVQFRLATLRMQPLLKPAPVDAKKPLPAALLKPLSDEEDEHIWGAVAATLERLMKDDHARAFAALDPTLARFSPRMQQAARQGLRRTEARLLQRPDQTNLWRLWTFLATCADQLQPRRILAACPPVPGLRAELPPTAAMEILTAAAREIEAWTALRDLFMARFELERDPDSGEFQTLTLFSKATLGGEPGPWRQGHRALMEALIRLGETRKAEEVLTELVARNHYGKVYHHAALVAEACGEPELAAAWREKETRQTEASKGARG